MSAANRRLLKELVAMVDQTVKVVTIDGQVYHGTLVGINSDTLSLSLEDSKDKDGKMVHRMFLNGNSVAQILSLEKPFDLKSLAERFDKVFPTMVRLYEDQGFIWIMDKIKVTEKGVLEGTGPAAERVKGVYDRFVKESKGQK